MVITNAHSRAADIIEDLGSNNDFADDKGKQFIAVEGIPVHGMTCQSCVRSITNAVSSLFGISNIAVSLDNEEATVSFDSSKITKSTIIETIENCGFNVPSNTS